MIKFISTSYFPLDRDIVREQWVLGDLKDRLGVQHRKNRDVESAPMFHAPHARSLSEVSVVYEPALTRSPGDHELPGGYSDDTPPPSTQYKRSPLSQDSSELIAIGPISPQPPYYSAPDIHGSNSGNLRNRYAGEKTPPMAAGSSSVSRSPPNMQQKTQLTNPSAYEMQVRDQPHPGRVQEVSETSYRTAASAWPEDDVNNSRSRSVTPGLTDGYQGEDWRHAEARAL